MALLAHYPLSTTFAGISHLQANGTQVTGNAQPTGVPGTFDLINGAVRTTCRESDPFTYGERRSEMLFRNQLDPTGERWYTWEFMIPGTWNFNTGMVVMQIHETNPAGSDPVAVQFVLLLENNQLVSRVPVNVLVPGGDSYRLGSHPFVFDRWYSMCFHANWQIGNTGFWELFVDKIPMLKRYSFANAYDFPIGGYLKLGIYNYAHINGWGTKEAYYRNVKIWSGNDGYQAVMGGVPMRPDRVLQL